MFKVKDRMLTLIKINLPYAYTANLSKV